MISHFVVDDKFIDAAYETFEEVNPGNNRYILLSFTKKLKYIKKTPVEIINPFTYILSLLVGRREENTIIHWMDYKKILVLSLFGKKKLGNILWIGWGADYYYYFKNLNSLLQDKTSDLFNGKSSRLSLPETFKNFLQESVKSIFRNIFIRFGLSKISYFSPVLKNDYETFKAAFPTSCPAYLPWNYGSLEDYLISGVETKENARDILIGNSASVENNHLEILDILKLLPLGERKIICPLSYGDSFGFVKDAIKEKGKEYFGDSFVPLENFIPLSEYNSIISSCSIVIMNHLRQQGLGNILTMMYTGARIYLRRENTIFPALKGMGAIIFDVDELLGSNQNLTRLTHAEIETNREVLRAFIGKKVMQIKTKNLIEALISNETLSKELKPKILFLAPQKSPWIKRDYEILRGSFPTNIRYVLKLQDVFKVLPSIISSDCLYLWFGSLKFFLPVLIAKLLNKKVVIISGGFEVAAVEDIHYGAFCSSKPSVLKLMRRYMLSSSDKVLCVSKSNYEQSIEVAQIPKDKCEIVPLFVENHQIPVKAFENKKKQVILVANIYSKESFICKGVDVFIDVARRMPSFKFIVMGIFKEHLIPTDLPQNMHIVGARDYLSDDFIQLIQESLIALQPSRHESFCSSIVEAATLGTFPIGSNNYALKDVIPKIGGIVSHTNTPDSYVEIINSVLTSGYDPVSICQKASMSFTYEERHSGIVNEIKKFTYE